MDLTSLLAPEKAPKVILLVRVPRCITFSFWGDLHLEVTFDVFRSRNVVQ